MPQRPRRKRNRGQAAVESVMALTLLCLIFFALFQVSYLFICRIVAHHTAFVTARSYVVGFEEKIVNRAREVGSIGMSGRPTEPPALTGLTPAELGAIEPALIAEFVQSPDYTMWYEHWGKIDHSQPISNPSGPVTIEVEVKNFPLQVPLSQLWMNGKKTVDFESEARLLNHAGYYLE